MLIRTNSILKLDLVLIESASFSDLASPNSMDSSITQATATLSDGHGLVRKNTKKKKDDFEAANILAPDKHGSSFICCTDQDEEENETQAHAQTTFFSCSSSSSFESNSSKTTIANYLGIHQYAPAHCNDAASVLIEQRLPYQSDDDNEEYLNHDWLIQDASGCDAADHVDQGSFVSSVNLNQQERQQQHTDAEKISDLIHVHKRRQEEEWFKGTLFYDDPGTPPTLPPKDYISINNHSIYFDEQHKALYDQDNQSMYQQSTPSPSLYSLAISTKIGNSIKSRHKSLSGKVRNVLKRKSILSRA